MAKEMLRQGGRSARIQEVVHRSVRDLLATTDRSEMTVPMIAEKSGVTPSTIYRRWGDLSDLLADVALARMRPIADPDDTGAMASDLEAFVVDYAEEMSSSVGRQMISDVLNSSVEASAFQCCQFTQQHLQTLRDRAVARGEAAFDIDRVMDRVIAPIMYHILFRDRDVAPDYCRRLVAECLSDNG